MTHYKGHLNFSRDEYRDAFLAQGADKTHAAVSDKIGIDFERTPHVIVAGSTGYGKSVLLHTIVLSLCYGNSPDTVQFIFCDPKMVELNRYRTLPHAYTAPATDLPSCMQSLRMAESLMMKRYRKLKSTGGNRWKGTEIYVVIDEVAQLIMQDKSTVRLLQSLTSLGRAAGIHALAATQYPTRSVLSGAVMVNFDGRICLHLDDPIAYRTVLGHKAPFEPSVPGEFIYKSGAMIYRGQAVYTDETDYQTFLNGIRINGRSYDGKRYSGLLRVACL